MSDKPMANLSDAEFDALDKALGLALPTYCECRGLWGSGIVGAQAWELYLKDRGISADSIAAMTTSMMLLSGNFNFPDHIHDLVCPCRKPKIQHTNGWNSARMPHRVGKRLKPREQYTADNIRKWGLPTKEKPLIIDGFTCWTMASGGNKQPVTEVRMYRGDEYVGSASYRSFDSGHWSLYSKKDGKPTNYPNQKFDTFTEAIKFLVKDLS